MVKQTQDAVITRGLLQQEEAVSLRLQEAADRTQELLRSELRDERVRAENLKAEMLMGQKLDSQRMPQSSASIPFHLLKDE